jgi:mono/diheme cytochrome c family protein
MTKIFRQLTVGLLFALFCFFSSPVASQTPSWSEDIACIIYNNCSTCHNLNGIAPFPLMRYEDAAQRAASIVYFTENKLMPPWPPDPDFNSMKNERILSAEEIQLIKDWVDGGAPRGDVSSEPHAPVFESNETITEPDLVIQLPHYTSRAIQGDEYRCFVIPIDLEQDMVITGLEVMPGNRNIVHHVLVYHDATNTPVNNDNADPDEGYLCFGGIGSNSANLIGGWVPGQSATFYPDGMGVPLPAKTNVVVQLHYPHGSAGLSDQTHINLKLAHSQGIRPIRIDPMLNHIINIDRPLIIPANTVQEFREEFVIPIKVTVLGAAPHMHLIGTSIKTYAIDLAGDTIPLIDIPRWDFEWQGFYDFKKPVILEPGTRVIADAVYDNTLNNIFNPSNPPINVFLGEATTDEMMLVFFPWMFYQPGDENLEFEDDFPAGNTDCERSTLVEELLEEQINIYPNPLLSDQFHIQFEQGIVKGKIYVELRNLEGVKVQEKELARFPNQTFKMESSVASGLYFVLIYDDKNSLIARKKLVKI